MAVNIIELANILNLIIFLQVLTLSYRDCTQCLPFEGIDRSIV